MFHFNCDISCLLLLLFLGRVNGQDPKKKKRHVFHCHEFISREIVVYIYFSSFVNIAIFSTNTFLDLISFAIILLLEVFISWKPTYFLMKNIIIFLHFVEILCPTSAINHRKFILQFFKLKKEIFCFDFHSKKRKNFILYCTCIFILLCLNVY